MIDPKLLRQDLTELKAKLAKRGYELDMDFWQQMESQRKSLQVITEDLQAKRNAGAKQVGVLKKNGEDASELLAEMQAVSGDIKKAEEDLKALQDKINEAALQIPNIPADDVPEGESEEDNVEVRKWGTPKQFDFEIKDHTDVGEGLGQLDFAAAAKLTGSRFNVLTGQLAQLHRALIQFMLNTHTVKYGYTECYVPYIVNSDSLKGTGQLPKFEEDLFKLTNHTNNDGMGFYLIPTAEVPMTNLVRGERLEASKLPLKFTAHTPCFRSEAGSHGRDTRGLIRQHQFEKVEMVNIATAAQSDELLEQMTAQAEYILQQLDQKIGQELSNTQLRPSTDGHEYFWQKWFQVDVVTQASSELVNRKAILKEAQLRILLAQHALAQGEVVEYQSLLNLAIQQLNTLPDAGSQKLKQQLMNVKQQPMLPVPKLSSTAIVR